MTSITTERTASRQDGPELAVRLSPATRPHTSGGRTAPPPQHQQQFADPPPRRQPPRKPAMPRHPIPAMQEAFAESLAEATSGTLSLKPKLSVDTPQTRRDRLIDQDKSEGPPAALWRYRPGQNCHELRKLLAQIAFGVYLLLKGMANSNAQVVAILQGHIDEVDDYLRATMDDIGLAHQDLTARLEHLRLPLENISAFEEMLEDRAFRLRIVEGNVRIEHILSRTTTALVQIMQDVKEGLRSAQEFNTYLETEVVGEGSWKADQDVADIFEAMRGNADGWLNAFFDLEEKSRALDILIAKLADMVTEMDKCAGEVSRRTRFSIQPFSLPEHDKHESRLSHISQNSLESSDASSHETTPPASPGIHVPQLPPRISLRLSILDNSGLTSNFLDMDSDGGLFGPGPIFPLSTETASSDTNANKAVKPTAAPAAASAAAPAVAPVAKVVQLARVEHAVAETKTKTPETPKIALPAEEEDEDQDSEEYDASSPDSKDSLTFGSPINAIRDSAKDADKSVNNAYGHKSLRVPPRASAEMSWLISADPEEKDSPSPKAEKKEEPQEEEVLFILQPRTYTPQPAAPLPSPMIRESDRNTSAASLPLARAPEPEESSPRPVPPRNIATPSSNRGHSPAARGEEMAVHMRTIPNRRRRQDDEQRSESSRSTNTLPSSAPSVESPGKPTETAGTHLRNRSSIRERVSLRTTPPEAIQVPAPNAPALQRPVFASPRTYQNYKTFTGPDSAYSPDVERSVARSFTDFPCSNTSGIEIGISPPSIPGLIPSPHSDQQYFRPVLASPHSPLQQRPHTAGQVHSRPHHLRNAPSTMGMSMLSSVTTMAPDGEGGQTLKKKRSALGWLKKAFTLDEDERANFDQRKNQSVQNGYYDNRGPKFLDGRRIR